MAKHPHLDRAAFALRREAAKLQMKLPDDMAVKLLWAVFDALPDNNWYAICTEFQQEEETANRLCNQGFQVYRPKVFFHSDDDDFIEFGPMDYRLPGHLLVLIDRNEEVFSAVKNTKGVTSFVRGATGGDTRPIALRRGTVERFRQFEELDFARATAKKPEPREDLYEGAVVIVDDKTHWVYGQSGPLMFLGAKIAKVLVGGKYWEVEPAYLKKVEKPKKAKKKVEQSQQKRAA